MKREEEIKRVANDYKLSTLKHKDIDRACYARVDFVAGAHWADEHPINLWISVEDRLPPIKTRVLFLDKNGKAWLGRNTIAMQAELETDENNNLLPPPTVPPAKPVITHWMPIPETPKV